VVHERRPAGPYFEQRTALLSQGDIFHDVPLAFPSPADAILVEEATGPSRSFLSGPLDYGPAMLITPTCSMRAQALGRDYAHPVRTLVPLRPVAELIGLGILDVSKQHLAEARDSLINYMYVPSDLGLGLPESLALLYMPVTLHHEMISEARVTQLTYDAASQLQKKLTWFASSLLADRADFNPPMD
jgi:hypothetical protein